MEIVLNTAMKLERDRFLDAALTRAQGIVAATPMASNQRS